MTVMRPVLRNAVASGLLVVVTMAAPAYAESRTTSFATFLHIGPGRQYAVTDEVPTRTEVDVRGCENDWCQIQYGSAFGWVDERMLAAAGPPASSPQTAGQCVDFTRTGWPHSGDHERLCIPSAVAAPPAR